MSMKNLSVSKGRPVHKTDNLTAICLPMVQKMWEAPRLTTVWASLACSPPPHNDDHDVSGAYTTHAFVCRMGLTSYDQIPEKLADYCYVEFTMPATQVSHTTVRSVSLSNGAKDEPPEKYVRYLARHEYRYEHSADVVNGYCFKLRCHMR
jgi:hypothetical protein